MPATLTFRYVTYLASAPEQVWHALTDPELTAAFWGHSNVSDWQPGSRWEHRRTDGSGVADVEGRVVESAPPTRLVTTWAEPGKGAAQEGPGVSTVTFGIEPYEEIVRLTLTHEGLADEAERDAAAQGWAAVLANLKTLLETGSPLPREPWAMP
ncbi:GntR family transcriptional regulator [Streptomyces sp. CB02923]|uniref:SRPBCC family protein n=1 Tax=Streptomyces sp. CB02923 TaxID=1718985 RepID=UPI00093B25D6|nr:GntR family transcriptional regulator [Streptomyces sp. CB02923]